MATKKKGMLNRKARQPFFILSNSINYLVMLSKCALNEFLSLLSRRIL